MKRGIGMSIRYAEHLGASKDFKRERSEFLYEEFATGELEIFRSEQGIGVSEVDCNQSRYRIKTGQLVFWFCEFKGAACQ